MLTLIVTAEASRWQAFTQAWTEGETTFAATPAQALERVKDTAARPELILWDEPLTGDALRQAAVDVMFVSARIHQCVCTALPEEKAHDMTEGLGFLPAVSVSRSADEAAALAKALRAVSAL